MSTGAAASGGYFGLNSTVEIFVHPEDEAKAGQILREDWRVEERGKFPFLQRLSIYPDGLWFGRWNVPEPFGSR